MATLTIDGTDYPVVGKPSWSTQPYIRQTTLDEFGEMTRAFWIRAVIDIRGVDAQEVDRKYATILLTLDDGRTFEGVCMQHVGSGITNGVTIEVEYQG